MSAVLVRDALATLDAGHRAALEQTCLRDQTIAEAARQLDLPVGTVRSRRFYALRHPRTAIAA